jgi:hypothetical protein
MPQPIPTIDNVMSGLYLTIIEATGTSRRHTKPPGPYVMWGGRSRVSSLSMWRTNRGWCSSSSDGGAAGDRAPTFVKSCAPSSSLHQITRLASLPRQPFSASRGEARLCIRPTLPKRLHRLLAAYPSKRSPSLCAEASVQ